MQEICQAVARALAATGIPCCGLQMRRVSGGCIHESFLAEDPEGRRYFCKLNDISRVRLFETEEHSLTVLAETGAIRVPRPLVTGTEGGRAFLVMEALDLRGRGDSARMGRELAVLHQRTPERRRYGWREDNFIGSTVQENEWREGWVDFFREKRLEPQLRWARESGRRFRGGAQMLEGLDRWLGGHDPEPSLLHGDLWGGNAAFDETGRPVIFDPASYWGDRETDLAFSRMFGGFPAEFYAAYAEAWPLPPSERDRMEIYNLYHLLNHFNLFGESYGESAQRVIDRFV